MNAVGRPFCHFEDYKSIKERWVNRRKMLSSADLQIVRRSDDIPRNQTTMGVNRRLSRETQGTISEKGNPRSSGLKPTKWQRTKI